MGIRFTVKSDKALVRLQSAWGIAIFIMIFGRSKTGKGLSTRPRKSFRILADLGILKEVPILL
jgi:hypothetical protein